MSMSTRSVLWILLTSKKKKHFCKALIYTRLRSVTFICRVRAARHHCYVSLPEFAGHTRILKKKKTLSISSFPPPTSVPMREPDKIRSARQYKELPKKKIQSLNTLCYMWLLGHMLDPRVRVKRASASDSLKYIILLIARVFVSYSVAYGKAEWQWHSSPFQPRPSALQNSISMCQWVSRFYGCRSWACNVYTLQCICVC